MRLVILLLILLGSARAAALPCPATLSCPTGSALQMEHGMGCMAKGKQHGRTVVCHSGILVQDMNYKDGKLHGEQNYYGDGQKLVRRERYLNGSPKGLWERWVPGTDMKEDEVGMDGDQRHGVYRRFHRNGQLAEQVMIDHGVAVGARVQYHEDGSLYFLNGTAGGRANGEQVLWYPNGQVHMRTHVVAGVADGPHVEFAQDGHLLARGAYKDNLFDGPWVEVGDDHTWTGNYIRGQKDGPWTKMDDTGQQIELITYSNGVMDGPTAKWKEGVAIEEGTWLRGVKDGLWTTRDKRGDKTRETFADGVQSETCTRKDGKLACRAVVGWRLMDTTACKRRHAQAYGATSKTLESQEDFDAYFDCGGSPPSVDWARFRVYSTSEGGVLDGSSVASVKRARGKLTVNIAQYPYCGGIPPRRGEVRFDVLLLAGEDPIGEERTWVKPERDCGLRP